MRNSIIVSQLKKICGFLKRSVISILLFVFAVVILNGCKDTGSLADGLPGDNFHSSIEWAGDNPQHDNMFISNPENCISCHGEDLNGGQAGVSCVSCHHNWGSPEDPGHGSEFINKSGVCRGCHGKDLNGGLANVSCLACHHNGGWNDISEHGPASYENHVTCTACHGVDLSDNKPIISCNTCHHNDWSGPHGTVFAENPEACKLCHKEDLNGPTPSGSCVVCHHDWGNPKDLQHIDSYPQNQEICEGCHGVDLKGGLSNVSCFASLCHHGGDRDTWGDDHGSDCSPDPDICNGCHGDFSDINGGPVNYSCNTCHHSDWSSDTVAHPAAFSQNPDNCKACHGDNFNLTPGGSAKSCLSCHHYNNWDGATHGAKYTEISNICKSCHGEFVNGGPVNFSCFSSCHQNFNKCDQCHSGNGTSGSHLTHTTANTKGPGNPSGCDDCHDSSSQDYLDNHPYFADGNNLGSTDVCNNCHSPDGAYDGINDPNIGAKTNWSSKVYNGAGDALQTGKEKWCAGCHDDQPSLINSISAPGVVGDDINYGFYVNGHGRSGAEVDCLGCHDVNYEHIDGESRTYVAPDVTAPGDYYQSGYRLKSISSESPMIIPYRSNATPPAESFRLCFSCHTSTDPFLKSDNLTTNFREDSTSANYHYYHLSSIHNPDVPVGCTDYCHPAVLTLPWDSDLDGTGDSDMSCPACHNVHGSQSPAMVRTGELIGHTPGLNFKYLDNASTDPWSFKDPQTVDGSAGAAFDIPEASTPIGIVSENGICIMCHTQRIDYYRSPSL